MARLRKSINAATDSHMVKGKNQSIWMEVFVPPDTFTMRARDT